MKGLGVRVEQRSWPSLIADSAMAVANILMSLTFSRLLPQAIAASGLALALTFACIREASAQQIQ